MVFSTSNRRSFSPLAAVVLILIICVVAFVFPRITIVVSPPDCGQWQSGITCENEIVRKELDDLEGMDQFDHNLIEYLRKFHVFPPSVRERRYSIPYGKRVVYNFDTPRTISFIQKYLNNKTNGIFLEAGANNGADAISNTLILERDYNWAGLLVEGSPVVFPRLRAAHRRSYLSDLLLSPFTFPKLTMFRMSGNAYAGKAVNKKADPVTVMNAKNKPVYDFEVLTVPLYSLVAACKITTIDFLSLDVEGTEDVILKNFPFDKVFVKTMIVEVDVIGPKKTESLVKFLEGKGFQAFPNATPRDTIFIHKSLILENNI